MFFAPWRKLLRKLRGQREMARGSAALRRPTRRPVLELLENRLAPAVVTNSSAFPITVGDFLTPPQWSDVTPLAFHSPTGPNDPEPFQATKVGAPDDNSSLYVTLDPVGQDIFLLYDYEPLSQAQFAAENLQPGTTVATVSFPLTLTNPDGSTQVQLINVLIETAPQNSTGGGTIGVSGNKGFATADPGNLASTTTVSSSVNPSLQGNSVTFTATVSAAAPNTGTPTAGVTFEDGGVPIGTGALVGGVATFTTSTLAVGTHSITAFYSGDTNFSPSTSPRLTQTVNQGFGFAVFIQFEGTPPANTPDIVPASELGFQAAATFGSSPLSTAPHLLAELGVPLDIPAGFATQGSILPATGEDGTNTTGGGGDDGYSPLPQYWGVSVNDPTPASSALYSISPSGAITANSSANVTQVATLELPNNPGNVIDLATLKNTDTVDVAILSTPTFNATTAVNLTNLAKIELWDANVPFPWPYATPSGYAIQDVNGDGIPDLVLFFKGSAIKGALSDSTDDLALTAPLNGGGTLAGNLPVTIPGISFNSMTGVLSIVGGFTSNDHVQINPVGPSNTGSTGIQVQASLNGDHPANTSYLGVTKIAIALGGGNDNVQEANSLTIPTVVDPFNGNDNIQLGNSSNNFVTLGNGNDHVQIANGPNPDNFEFVSLGNGNDQVQIGDGGFDTVIAGNGNDQVQIGGNNNTGLDSNETVTLGGGNDHVQLGDGSGDIVTAGNGNDQVQIGSNNNSDNDNFESVSLGGGNNHVQLGDGIGDFVTAGDGNDQVQIGNNNTGIDNFEAVTLGTAAGTGNDNVQLGDGVGDFVFLPGGGNDQVQIGSNNNASLDSNAVVLLGAGNDHVQLGDGGGDFVIGAGVGGSGRNGNDQIQIGSNNNSGIDAFETVTLGGGNDHVQLGDGSGDVVTALGGNDQVQIGSNNNGFGNANVLGLDSGETVSLGGGNDNVQLGDGSGDSVTLLGGNDQVQIGSNNHGTLNGGLDNFDTVSVGSGHDQVQIGTGFDNTVTGTTNVKFASGDGPGTNNHP